MSLVLPLVPVLMVLPALSGPPVAAVAVVGVRPAVSEARVRVALESPEASLDRMLREIARDRSGKDGPSAARAERVRSGTEAENPAPDTALPMPTAKPAQPVAAAPGVATSAPVAAADGNERRLPVRPAQDRTPVAAERPAPRPGATGENTGHPLDLASGSAVDPSARQERGKERPAVDPHDLARRDRPDDDLPPTGDAPPPGWHDALRDRPPPALPGFGTAVPTVTKPGTAASPTVSDASAGVPNIAVLATDQRNIFPPDVLQKLQAIHLARRGAR